MLKRHFKRGSAEIVSVVLLIVVLGGLAIGISGGLANSTKANAKAGNEANKTQLEQTYNNIKSHISD